MGGAKHPAARSLIQRQLFDGLTGFRELEARITGLPTEQERGDAFEVFAEAYLATQPVTQAKEVWPDKVIPPSLRKRLSLHSTDVGADGVVETQTGQLHGYQVKYRSHRTPLTWTETATFFGVTDRCDQRFLFTNSDDVSAVMEQRKDFYCIRGSDLDKLEAREFEAMAAWLRGSIMPRVCKQPQPHQQEALDAILPALDKHDRATAIMACGTGKTLVALWVAERCSGSRPGSNILVLVPSLALLRQTLHEWLRETSWQNLAYLCVCSDPTVEKGADELIVRQADLDFPVTTDGGMIRKFIEQETSGPAPHSTVKVVFSTYQSAREVAKGMPAGFTFDLAIFDEAHKTAGREGRTFGFALEDGNLWIKKRLFLTATPRHYDVRKRDKEGDAKLVYSMDVPEVYGPVTHTLTFADAARRGIICNYKVIISVVTSDMVNDHVLRHGKVLVNGDPVHARQVANQLALQAAVEKHGVSKIFTFHRSVASAKSFTSDGGEGIGNHLSDFRAFHVNGTMSTAERESYMGEFRAAPKAVISNARCLTEGVDVPAVDMVAFLTPKRSKVDIVQATGRSMRKADSKTTGYILIPLFVEQAKGETIEDAVRRAEFDEVWNVLQAMQEQDAVLADIIRQMREDRGRTKGFDDTRFCERVEILSPGVSLKVLRQSITTSCINKLGNLWDERYGALTAFKRRFGHCNVIGNWSRNPQLGNWVLNQRQKRKRNELKADQIQKLDELGFTWELHDSFWEEMLRKLVAYKMEHGHCFVQRHTVEESKFERWVSTQRKARYRGELSDERIRRLDEIGFVWNPWEDTWDQMCRMLAEYRESHGHCDVPGKWRKNPKLGSWVLGQRMLRQQSKLNEGQINRLDKLGFVWDIGEAEWEKMFSDLVKYKRQCGDCKVKANWQNNPKLAHWVQNLRRAKKRGRFDKARIRRLDAIGFVWDQKSENLEEIFAALREFKRKHRHCNVPLRWPENRKLGVWVGEQRKKWKRGLLSEDRIQRLQRLGFEFDQLHSTWEKHFTELAKYKKQHGNCNVPTRWPTNPGLASWVGVQRRRQRTGSSCGNESSGSTE